MARFHEFSLIRQDRSERAPILVNLDQIASVLPSSADSSHLKMTDGTSHHVDATFDDVRAILMAAAE